MIAKTHRNTTWAELEVGHRHLGRVLGVLAEDTDHVGGNRALPGERVDGRDACARQATDLDLEVKEGQLSVVGKRITLMIKCILEPEHTARQQNRL